ncbi:hypothetical protein [Fructilactobacillus florum]|uniref:hypothetical protein n=1 Tax=Fructilactobacillus florum TaxID=640331 RepID=UPI0006D2095F|nr:hypothetical protein [Fructilactobacillus florum]
MKSIQIDPVTNDVAFNRSNGVFNFVNDNDELAQRIKILLGTNLGEIPWDRTKGFDQNNIIRNGKQIHVIETAITEYLKKQLNTFVEVKVTSITHHDNRVTDMAIDINLKHQQVQKNTSDWRRSNGNDQ